jgi:hypothetical protein
MSNARSNGIHEKLFGIGGLAFYSSQSYRSASLYAEAGKPGTAYDERAENFTSWEKKRGCFS